MANPAFDASRECALRWLMDAEGLPAEVYVSGEQSLDAYDGERPGYFVLDVRIPGIGELALLIQ